MTTYPQALPEVLDPESPAFRAAARRRWWLLATLIVIAPLVLVVTAVLALVVWLFAQHGAATRQVKAEVDRIHAAGEPITPADLHALEIVPPGKQDITRLWLTALNSFDEQKFNTDAKPLAIVGEGDANALSAADVPAAEQFLAQYDATVQATLVAARAEGECRFVVEYEKGFSALLPNAQKMRTLARILKLRGRVAAAKGDAEGAVESVEANFAAVQAMAHQMLLIEHLVRVAIAGVALAEVEQLLSELELTDEQLARLDARVKGLAVEPLLTNALMGERSVGYHMFHHMEQFSMLQGDIAAAPNPGDGVLSRPADCAMYLGFLREMITASREPFPTALDGMQKAENRLKHLAGTQNPIERYNNMITLLILPAVGKSFEATGRTAAKRDLTRCAIAAERFRIAHGRLPQKLDELVPQFLPAVPTDPFDGQPLRLKANEEELVFYSVGANRKDDGGVENEERSEPDLTVQLKVRP